MVLDPGAVQPELDGCIEFPAGAIPVSGLERNQSAPVVEMGILGIGVPIMDDAAFALRHDGGRVADRVFGGCKLVLRERGCKDPVETCCVCLQRGRETSPDSTSLILQTAFEVPPSMSPVHRSRLEPPGS